MGNLRKLRIWKNCKLEKIENLKNWNLRELKI